MPGAARGDLMGQRVMSDSGQQDNEAALHGVSEPGRVRRVSSRKKEDARVGYQSLSRGENSVHTGRRGQPDAGC